jgi:hypothetical protein
MERWCNHQQGDPKQTEEAQHIVSFRGAIPGASGLAGRADCQVLPACGAAQPAPPPHGRKGHAPARSRPSPVPGALQPALRSSGAGSCASVQFWCKRRPPQRRQQRVQDGGHCSCQQQPALAPQAPGAVRCGTPDPLNCSPGAPCRAATEVRHVDKSVIRWLCAGLMLVPGLPRVRESSTAPRRSWPPCCAGGARAERGRRQGGSKGINRCLE